MTAPTVTAGRSLDTVRTAIEATGAFIRDRNADAFMASCPLHDDVDPSLSVTWKLRQHGNAGAVLMHCFSCGAQAPAIAAALGLRMADLFDEHANSGSPRGTRAPQMRRRPPAARPNRQPDKKHPWKQVRVYTYTTATGAPVQQVIRQECDCDAKPGRHKRFLQRYRDGRRWEWEKPEGFTPVLYRARELARTAASEWVWLTEGEKDAENAARQGVAATTNPSGAGAFLDELAAQLSGRRVALVVDRDAAGYNRGLQLHEMLAAYATQIQILAPAPAHHKADLTDHIDDGHWDDGRPFGGLTLLTVDDLTRLSGAVTEN